MGRHYLLSQINNKRNNLTFFNFLKEQNKKRHYTESFCMRVHVIENILKLAADPNDMQASKNLINNLNKGNSNSVCLTIKNYEAHKGLSSLIFEDIKKKEERVYLL